MILWSLAEFSQVKTTKGFIKKVGSERLSLKDLYTYEHILLYPFSVS